ncbi:hypothetical protein [Methylobacterium sp. 1030]|uniref:hypothetical protein n=1 Tax=Methylobacterium sp. 1030 TaxID=3156404 RepID=UPI00339A73E8
MGDDGAGGFAAPEGVEQDRAHRDVRPGTSGPMPAEVAQGDAGGFGGIPASRGAPARLAEKFDVRQALGEPVGLPPVDRAESRAPP